MKGKVLMCLMFTGYVVRELWTLVHNDPLVSPFPFSEQQIYFKSYLYIGSVYCMWCITTYILYAMSTEFKTFWHWVFIIQVLEFAEFFLNYNEAWSTYRDVNINVTNFRYIALFLIIIYEFIRYGRNDYTTS